MEEDAINILVKKEKSMLGFKDVIRTFIIHGKVSKINSNRNSEGVDFHPVR